MPVIVPYTFVAGTVIDPAEVNSNFTVLASAIDNALPRDGSQPMLGPLEVISGSGAALSLRFAADTDTGFYRKASNVIAIIAGGNETATITATGYVFPLAVTMGANIAMGANKVTGLAAASANGEAVRYEQLQGIGGLTPTASSFIAGNGTAFVMVAYGTMATQAAGAVAITGGTITGITDLAIADGGTGASTADNARVNLNAALKGAMEGARQLNNASTTLALSDAGAMVLMAATSGPFNVLIPTNAAVAFANNTVVNIAVTGTQNVTITADTGVTLNGVSAGVVTLPPGTTGIIPAYALNKLATNVWLLYNTATGAV